VPYNKSLKTSIIYRSAESTVWHRRVMVRQ